MTIKFSKKICLLGDFAVGKTSLVRRFVYERFDDKYISTIGVKVSRKTVVIPYQTDIANLTMMLWDLAGSEEFSKMQASYLRGTAGAALVCDLTRHDTLENLPTYIKNLHQVSPKAKFIIAANKFDLTEQHQLTADQVGELAAKFDVHYYLTSAKTGNEVEIFFRQLGKMILD